MDQQINPQSFDRLIDDTIIAQYNNVKQILEALVASAELSDQDAMIMRRAYALSLTGTYAGVARLEGRSDKTIADHFRRYGLRPK